MSQEPVLASSHDGAHDHGSTGKYWLVFGVLCILTGASFFTYSDYWPYADTPSIGWAFMMAVSCMKAFLVLMFFMHLLWEANWKYVFTFPAAMMSVFLVLMLMPDIGCRTHHYAEERWLHTAQPQSADDTASADHQQHGQDSESGPHAGH